MSVSDLGIENWNPMAEDYASTKFNSYNPDQSQSYDLCSLYVKSVPSYLTQDSFESKFSEYGRIVRYRIYPTRENMNVTCGLVSFETPEEAQRAMHQLNRTPPLNMEITYANAKPKNATLKDVNMNMSKADQLVTPNISKTLGSGRGQPMQGKRFPALRIVLDGDKRVTSACSSAENKEDESLSEPHIPELIPNPNFLCLCCNKPGEFSCGVCKRPYCSSTCQAADWKHHKSICDLFSEKEAPRRQYKYDTGYMSECSNNSDNEKRTSSNQITDVIKNKTQNRSSKIPNSVKSPEPEVSRQRAFQKRSPQSFGGSNNESAKKQLIFIKGNEIEDSSLPLNRDEQVFVCNFQSPSKLWLHLNTGKSVLSEMEKRLNNLVDKSAVTCAVDDVCCTAQDGVLRRIKVTEVKANAITGELIDYGGTSTVRNDLVYHLPQTFQKYSSQAICCKLVDDDGCVNTQWNDEDFTSFHQYTKDKAFKVKAYRCYNNIYDVSLVNKEGVSLYIIIAQSLIEPFVEDTKPKISSLNQVPSVWSNLKEGMEVKVKSLESDNEKFWGILEDGSGYGKCLEDLGNLLQNIAKETEVINMSCEEGDVAVGFSAEFKLYYRCVILKRLRSSFLVRYIDFGNKEEITELRSATLPVLQKRSYVVCCTKPESMSSENFKKVFENLVYLSVKSVKSSVIELSFPYERRPMILQCFPWDHGISNNRNSTAKSPTCKIQGKESVSFKSIISTCRLSKDEVKINENMFCKPLKQTSPVAQTMFNKTGATIPKTPVKVMKDSISDKTLTVGSKYNVNISFIKTTSEMYVQFIEDKQLIFSLCQQINQYCTSDTCLKYSPVKDEMVCCKFSEDNNWYRAQVLEKSADNKFKVLFIDFGNEDIVSDINLKPLPQKFVRGKLSACVSLHNVRNEDISNLLTRLLEELWIMEVKADSKHAKVMLFQGQKSLLEFIDGKSKFLRSSLNFQKLHINAVSEVVICYVDEEKLYFHEVKDLKAIQILQEKINSGNNKALSSKPEINSVYCCRSVDNIWYRVCVQSEVSPHTFRVNFIDFGNDEEVSSKDFKEISKELFALPVYCITVIADDEDKALLKPETHYSIQVIGEKAGTPKVKFLNLSEDRQQNICLSSFEKLTLKNGINEVIFCHSENGVYYCQLIENIEDVETMSEKLQTSESKLLVKAPQVEEVVCAKSNDTFWYRASIESVSNLNYKVCFIDFGNSELVSAENVNVLLNEFHKFPIFCIPVRIKNIAEVEVKFNSIFSLKPAGFASDGSQFAEIVLPKSMDLPNISSLKNKVLPVDEEVDVTFSYFENGVYYANMTSSKELIESLEVELKNTATFEDLSDLPKAGDVMCAKCTDGIWYRGSVKNVSDDQKSCEIYFIDYGNSEVIALKDIKMLPTKLSAIPILAVAMKVVNVEELEKQVLANVSVFKIKVVERSSDNIQIVELVDPATEIEPSSLETQLLPESPTEVTVSYKEGGIFYVQKLSDEEILRDIMENLQTDTSMKTVSSPKVGQLLCVKLSDGILYRGLIKEKSGSDFKAFFVDYGNTDTVTDIFSLPSKYSASPMFCIPVIISNEKSLASPLNIDSFCRVKYTGKMTDNVQVVRVCPTVDHILLPSIKTTSLEKGSFDVYFHSFDGQFYFVSKTADVVNLNKMECVIKSFKGDEIYHVPSVEEVLLVKCEEMWYRGCVRKINETTKKCEVFLIDLGSTKTIPFYNMSYIPKSISSFPIFLNKVSLSPSDILKTPISFGKRYTITVVEVSKDVSVVKVLQPVMFTSIERKTLPLNETRNVIFFYKEKDTLFLQDANDAVLVSEMSADARKCASTKVISHHPIVGELLCAQSDSDGDWYRCCIEEVVDSDKYKIHYIDYGNSEVVSKENMRYLSSSLTMYPSFGIAVKIVDQLPVALEQLYSVIAVSEPVNNIQPVKLLLQEKACSEPAVEKMSEANKNSEEIEPTSKFFLSSFEHVSFSPGEQEVAMYNIAENDAYLIFCTPFIRENMAANIALINEITEYCETLGCSSYNGDFLPEEGEMVMAKFDEDSKWYRAVVMECADPYYHVIFSDFGNSQELHKDSLRKMERQFMTLPIQAQLCSLTGFEAIGDNVSIARINEELKNFLVFVYPEPLKAIVTISTDEEIAMEIPIITNHLVEKGLLTVGNS